MANGNISIQFEIGEKGCLYVISIHNFVSIQYTCHQSKAHTNHIDRININEIASQSMYFDKSSFFNFKFMKNVIKNQITAHTKEKL